jgi:hypothetical protein
VPSSVLTIFFQAFAHSLSIYGNAAIFASFLFNNLHTLQFCVDH